MKVPGFSSSIRGGPTSSFAFTFNWPRPILGLKGSDILMPRGGGAGGARPLSVEAAAWRPHSPLDLKMPIGGARRATSSTDRPVSAKHTLGRGAFLPLSFPRPALRPQRPTRSSTGLLDETPDVCVVLCVSARPSPIEAKGAVKVAPHPVRSDSSHAISAGTAQSGARCRQARAGSGGGRGGSRGSCRRWRTREPGRRLGHAGSRLQPAVPSARRRDRETEGWRGRQGSAVELGLPLFG